MADQEKGAQPTEAPVTALLDEGIPGWELEWARHKDEVEDLSERNKRYGLVHTVERSGDEYLIKVFFPERIPNCGQKFMLGLPDRMPDYAYDVVIEGRVMKITGRVPNDEKILALCGGTLSFPRTFTTRFAFEEEIGDAFHRYIGKTLVIRAYPAAVRVEQPPLWDAHYILENCVGCGVCDIKCPTKAITGIKKERYIIEPNLCINCGVCGVYCPYDSIVDQRSVLVERVKAKEIPKAYVIDELCTGCAYCVDVCPFDCISLIDPPDPLSFVTKLARVDEKKCVSCKLCEQVCIKEAIIVPRPQEFPRNLGWSYQIHAAQ
jgi:electron transport complex protein RnfB